MSEPHELEERAARRLADVDNEGGSYEEMARAVLNLVRQEQEKDATDAMVNAPPKPTLANCDEQHYARAWLPMIRAWWLSHTAKETSNG